MSRLGSNSQHVKQQILENQKVLLRASFDSGTVVLNLYCSVDPYRSKMVLRNGLHVDPQIFGKDNSPSQFHQHFEQNTKLSFNFANFLPIDECKTDATIWFKITAGQKELRILIIL